MMNIKMNIFALLYAGYSTRSLRQSKGMYIEFILSENRHSTREVWKVLLFFFIIIIHTEEKIRISHIAISFTWNIYTTEIKTNGTP